MKSYFQQLAKYNQWANGRLHAYAAVLELPNEMYRKPTGVFFVSQPAITPSSRNGSVNQLDRQSKAFRASQGRAR
jgi:hypothetical protein